MRYESYAPQPAYSHGPSYHQSSYKEPANYDTPYQFDYAVNDHYSGAVFSQNENSDTKNVNGYYSVNLYAPQPAYSHGPSYHQSSYKEPANYDTPYQFDYAVNDHYSGAVFSQNENSDTKNVNGYYSHVTYVADHDGYGGYIAEMTYTGEPRYEDHKPSYHPVPAYKPGRSHARAPAYKTMY
ncbi:cuticle protein 7-like [Pollicipes pollicipes]|uniref:cuticle protein 7-like n=1 Tax=Pollicipes pollicipes TaxID=41117 RepID=UPI001884CF52|nr:cuticle protein 7-like [Pollicipes pollicipes]